MKAMEGRKVLLVAAVSLVVGLTATQIGSARAPWLLFGYAQFVKMGQGDNPWAVQLRSDLTVPPYYAGVAFIPPGGDLHFQDLWLLQTDFDVTDDDCGGGSPRFAIAMDTDGDGTFDGNVHVYLGPVPNFTGCASGWQSTGNLIGTTELRYDLTQVGGTFYDTYANALVLVGTGTVLYVALIVDSGWIFGDGEQTILVDNVAVNDHLLDGHGARTV